MSQENEPTNKTEGTFQQASLAKKLGFWYLWAIAVGAVVGDGIFMLMGSAFSEAGPSSILAFLIAGILQAFLMISFGELAVGMPSAGGPQLWGERLLGKEWGVISNLSFAIGWIIAGGSTGLAIGAYTQQLLGLNGVEWQIIFALVWNLIFALANIAGVIVSATFQFILTASLVIIMIIFGVAGVTLTDPNNFTPFMPNGMIGMIFAIPMGAYAYMGASTVVYAGEETKSAINLPKVLVWSSVTFIAVYTLSQIVVVGSIPYSLVPEMAENMISPYTLAAEHLFGGVAATIMNLAAWLAAATCLLMGTMYAPPRSLYALARAGYRIPRSLSSISKTTRAPVMGTVITLIISELLVLLGWFDPNFVYVTLALQLVFAWCISWLISLAAVFVYRKKYAAEVQQLKWRIPLYPITPIIGLIGIIVVIVFTFMYSIIDLIAGIAWVALLYIATKYYICKERTF
ncbi:MAG: amino acid permease [Candidatus Methanomethyliaceae archaeon]|nr:amino acid permease [Candidatus Methanomethyliaceae archaeon]